MDSKKILQKIGITLKLLALSLILMLAIGQIQLFYLTRIDSYQDIQIGYPFWYYSFSREGNNFHGSNASSLIIDYILTVAVVLFIDKIEKFFISVFSTPPNLSSSKSETSLQRKKPPDL